MLGSASDAEDMVQETYLRYRTAQQAEIRSLKSFLMTVVTRLCLDELKSAHVQREQYLGYWLPEPVLTEDAETLVEQRESLSLAFLTLLEELTPAERAVFVLHTAFDYPYDEIGNMRQLDPSPEGAGLASGLHRNSAYRKRRAALASRSDVSGDVAPGRTDKTPVLIQSCRRSSALSATFRAPIKSAWRV